MSFLTIPIEVKEQIFAHLPLSARMSLRQCSRIDQHVVTISTTVLEDMIIDSEYVMLKSQDERQMISHFQERDSYEIRQSMLNEKLNHFLKIVGSRLHVKKIVLKSTCEVTSNFILQLNWERIGCIDLVPSSPEDLARFFDVIGDRGFNLELERKMGNFLSIEKIYEARSLKLVNGNCFNDQDMEKFRNLRRFESLHPGYLTIRTLRTFIRRWIENEDAEYHYFHLETDCSFYRDPDNHELYMNDPFEGFEDQKYCVNDGTLLIEKSNSEVGRLRYEEDCIGRIKMCFVANDQLKSDTDCEIFEHLAP